MKKTLKEELLRIHEITYGNNIINESFIDGILNKIGIKNDTSNQTSSNANNILTGIGIAFGIFLLIFYIKKNEFLNIN